MHPFKKSTVSWNDFENIGLRVGTIFTVEDFPDAKVPAYKVWVDLGELGVKRSSAQITKLYTKHELMGKQVICVTNFAPKQIGPFSSEILITGFAVGNGEVVLIQPERKITNGLKLG